LSSAWFACCLLPWWSVCSNLLHVTCVGDADLVFENLFSCANASRSFSSSSYSTAKSTRVPRFDTYALRKILRLGVQFSLMILKVLHVDHVVLERLAEALLPLPLVR